MAIRTPDSPRLPQPGWRLTGFASIGLAAGLFTADAPLVVLAVAFIPALISMVVIARRHRIDVSDDDNVAKPGPT